MDADLRRMVLYFRIVELQSVLGLVGGNQRGRKAELQARVLELVESNPAPIQEKIKELFHNLRISKYGNAADLNPISGPPAPCNSGNTPLNGNLRMPPLKPAPIMRNPIGVEGGGQAKHYPNVRMEETPFYDEVAVLIPVTSLPCESESLQQEARYPITMSLAQWQEVLATGKKINVKTKTGLNVIKYQFSTQIQLCFMRLDSSEEQDDAFPPYLQVFVNGYAVQLPDFIMSNRPGVLLKRQSKPVDITAKLYGSEKPSVLHVKWMEQSKEEPNFGILVRIARQLTPDDLFGRLISKEVQPPEVTKEQIRKLTAIDDDDEEMCAPLYIPVSLACPLGGSRMSFPCRASTCEHLQCFDAKSFLMLNALKPTFICPICRNRLKFGDLVIDGYFMDVIKKTPISAANLIEILPDGTWLQTAPRPKPMMKSVEPPSKRLKVTTRIPFYELNENVVCKDASAAMKREMPGTSYGSVKQGNVPELIDIADSSDDEDHEN